MKCTSVLSVLALAASAVAGGDVKFSEIKGHSEHSEKDFSAKKFESDSYGHGYGYGKGYGGDYYGKGYGGDYYGKGYGGDYYGRDSYGKDFGHYRRGDYYGKGYGRDYYGRGYGRDYYGKGYRHGGGFYPRGHRVSHNTCSANGHRQVCNNGILGGLVQVLGSNCKNEAYCCNTGKSFGGLVNINALNCAKLL